MKRFLKNKGLRAALFLLLLIPSFLLGIYALDELSFGVTLNGDAVSRVTVERNEKVSVSLRNIPKGAELQWQIRLSKELGSVWVDIVEQKGETLSLSYALVANAMDSTGNTAVRCVATMGKTKTVTSPVAVQTVFSVSNGAVKNAAAMSASAGSNAIAMQTNEEQRFVEVRIEYVDEEGNKVFDPYVAYLAYGTDFKPEEPINSPIRLGYGAYKDGVTPNIQPNGSYTKPNAESITLAFENITTNQTVTVVYYKVPVPYYVRYYLQNVNNDLYTEAPEHYIEGSGLAGTYPVGKIEIDIPGFTPLYHQPEKIAVDGSTMFEVRYDRNYYLFNFKLEGGYGSDPIYARYDTHMVVPNPVKHGYRFVGWDLVSVTDENGNPVTKNAETGEVYTFSDNKKDTLPQTMPNENRTYKALWEIVNTSYTVIYWKADLDDNNPDTAPTYSYLGKATIPAKSATEISGMDSVNTDPDAGYYSKVKEHQYYSFDPEKTLEEEQKRTDLNENNKVIVEGDGSTIINVYCSRNSYTIRYIYARKNGTKYNLGRTTGCGSYNGNYSSASHSHSSVNWGYSVNAKPTVKADSGFEDKSFSEGNYTYYYIELTAEYEENIEDRWPAAVIEPSGNYKFGSWAAECASPYRGTYGAEHANVIGPYPTMSAEMIVDGSYTSDNPDHPYAQTMVAWWGGSGDNVLNHFYHIYYEVLPGTANEGDAGVVKKDGKLYRLERTLEMLAAHNGSTWFGGSTRVDPFVYTGFDIIESQKNGYDDSKDFKNNPECPGTGSAHDYCNVFYYNRKTPTLSFYNHSETCETFADEKLMYGQTISAAKALEGLEAPYEPPYPWVLEPNAYTFDKWYTTSDFIPGTEVNWNDDMPAGGLELFAKWVPVTRKVEFFYNYDALKEFQKSGNTSLYHDNPEIVTHGGFIGPTGCVTEPQPEEGYTFVGWFYFDKNGKKKAFSLYEMEVRQNLQLYAEWHSETRTEYIVHYKGRNPDGTVVDLAPSEQEYIFAGLTKTFAAKAGEELYPAFQEAVGGKMWFPETSSHSILMHKYEVGEDGTDQIPENNIYTFWYTYTDIPSYTVKYVDVQNGMELAPSKVVEDNAASVVTEQFLYIVDYMPDEAFKRLVLSANEEENVLTFYYMKQTVDQGEGETPGNPDVPGTPDTPDTPTTSSKTFYRVTHFVQNVGGVGGNSYAEYMSYDKVGNFGDTIYAADNYITISGFEPYPGHENTLSAVVLEEPQDEDGDGIIQDYQIVELKLYYNRLSYPYEVRYLNYSTHLPIDANKYPVKIGAAQPYGTEVTESAINIPGYTVVGAATQTVNINDKARDPDGDGTEHYNVITFYYSEKKANIFYYAVSTLPSASNFGHTSPTLEAQVTSGSVQGSEAVVYSGFVFKGWYYDADGTSPVPAAWVNGMKIKPVLNAETLEDNYSFYALFEPVKTELTVTKNVTSAANGKNDDVFLFRVQGVQGTVTANVDIIVPIQGNGSFTLKDIYCGQYTVTELNDWSWEYQDVAAQTITANENASNRLTFTNAYAAPDWLGGEGGRNNVFNGIAQ